MLKKICMILACSCPIFLVGAVTTVEQACAHSVGACTDHIVNACNAQWPNNYDARIACVNSGLDACETHTHGGGGGIELDVQDFGIEDEGTLNEQPGSSPQQERPQRETPERRVAPNR